jgi:hypothetical protein
VRRRLVIAAGILTVLVGALALAMQWRGRVLGDALADDVTRLSLNRSRSVHRGPALEGTTFEQCLGPLLDRAPPGGFFNQRQPVEVTDEISAVRGGTKSIEALRPDIRVDAARLLPWAAAVAGCTQAEGVGSAPGLGLFGDWDHPRQKAEPLPGVIPVAEGA